MIFKDSKEWSRFCPATVFEYNDEYFIGDAQGRRTAFKLLNRSRSDVRSYMVRADAIKSGKTEFLELVNKVSAELGCTSSIATYILIGTKATHKVQKGYTPYMYYEYIVKTFVTVKSFF